MFLSRKYIFLCAVKKHLNKVDELSKNLSFSGILYDLSIWNSSSDFTELASWPPSVLMWATVSVIVFSLFTVLSAR